MVTILNKVKLTDTTTSYDVRVKLDPGKSFEDYAKEYRDYVAHLQHKAGEPGP